MTPGGTERWSETSRYDERDRRTARIFHDGKADVFAYDPAGQVIAAAYGQAAAMVASASVESGPENGKPNTDKLPWHQTYQYDPAGNRTQFTDSGSPRTEGVSPSAESEPTLDSTILYQTNAANQYVGIRQEGTEASELEPRYDANGNLLNDDRNTYTWDADIHLLAVETGISSGAENGKPNTNKLRTKFAYDALHRRVARLEMRPKTGTPKTEHEQTLTHFIHDGWNVLEERSTNLNSQSTHLKSHTWGHDISGKPQGAGGIGGLLSSRNTENGTRATFHYDSNGNIVLLTDSEGNESARYAYDAFGKTLLATGPMAQENKYRFSTKPVEETSGLCYYGYRYYSPELGRWPSRDPIGETVSSPMICGYLALTKIRISLPRFIKAATEATRQTIALNNPQTQVDVLGLYTDAEWDFLCNHPSCASRASFVPDMVEEQMSQIDPQNGNDDHTEMNAIKHCSWMCMTAAIPSCGEDLALELGEAHEAYPGNNPNASDMDLHNNAVGASLADEAVGMLSGGEASAGLPCTLLCIEAAGNGYLGWYADTDGDGHPNLP
jgi:RHS repeat-associated protein